MMDLIPVVIDGAIVLNLQNSCSKKSTSCDECTHLVLSIHNWIRLAELEYAIIDLQDEKDICNTFMEELVLLRKRLRFPFLFVGVMEQAQEYLEAFNYNNSTPIFITPEDAVRTLRILHPGLTESRLKLPVKYGFPLLLSWKQMEGEAWSGSLTS